MVERVRLKSAPGSIALKWLLVLVSLSFVGVAQAQSTPKAYVTDFVGYKGQVDGLLAEQITKAVRQRLETDPTVSVVAPMSEEEAAAGPSPAIVEATRLYEVGRGQYVDQRFEEGVESLQGALKYFDGNVADIEDWGLIENLLFRISGAAFYAGKEAESKDAMRRLITFNPEFVVSAEEELPEGYREAFTELQERQKKRGSGSLDLSGVEEGAEIWLDGGLKGNTPMKLEGLTEGTHFLVLRKGEGVYGGLVSVAAKESTAVSVTIETAAAANPESALKAELREGTLNESARFSIRDLAARAASSVIVTAIIIPVDEGFAVQPLLYDVETTTVRSLEHYVFDSELLNVNVDGYKVSRLIIDALYDPSSGEVVDGEVAYSPATYAPVAVAVAPVSPVDPVVEPKDPVVEPKDPVVEPKDPVVEPKDPVVEPKDPVVEPKDPVVEPKDPVVEPKDPVIPIKPVVDPADVVAEADPKGEGELLVEYPIDESDAWYENTWLWTGVGVAVAAGATTAVLLMTLDGEDAPSGYNAAINW